MKRLKESFRRARREQRNEGANGEAVCIPDSGSRPFGLFILYPPSSDAEPAATRSKIDVEYTSPTFAFTEPV
jgi:hypothetical protein